MAEGFYGNTKKLAFNSFVFDYVYESRAQMDRCANTDDVFIGRYVLVSYLKDLDNSRYESTTINGQEDKLKEKDAFTERANEDSQKYRQSYHNTVWQKINYEGKGIYRLVAELNAEIPVCSLKPISPLRKISSTQIIYKTTSVVDGAPSEFYLSGFIADKKTYTIINWYYTDKYGFPVASSGGSGFFYRGYVIGQDNGTRVEEDPFNADNIKNLINQKPFTLQGLQVQEEGTLDTYTITSITTTMTDSKITSLTGEMYKRPYFNYEKSNELQYTLDFPKPVELIVHDENIDFNKAGFDTTTPCIDDKTENKIYWVSSGWAPSSNDIDSKTLFINLPAIGNFMSQLYDLMYGIPKKGETTRPLTKDGYKELIEAIKGFNGDGFDRATTILGLMQTLQSITRDSKGNYLYLGNWTAGPGKGGHITNKWFMDHNFVNKVWSGEISIDTTTSTELHTTIITEDTDDDSLSLDG